MSADTPFKLTPATTRSDFLGALRQARIATHRGDAAATERWLRICQRYLELVRLDKTNNADPYRRRRCEAPVHSSPLPRLFVRAARQMEKAILRGDPEAAWRWCLIAERQLDIAMKLADLDPWDNRLRRFRPALALLRKAALASEAFRAPDARERS